MLTHSLFAPIGALTLTQAQSLSQLWEQLTIGATTHWHQILYALLSMSVIWVLRKQIASLCMRLVFKLANTKSNGVDEETLNAVQRPISFGVLLFGLWGGTLFLGHDLSGSGPVIDGKTANVVHQVVSFAWFIVLAWIGFNFCDIVSQLLSKMAHQTETRMDDMLVPILTRCLKIFVTLITLILFIQNLGYSISALLAGFSIGGVALALASQDMLQNLFGSLMIFVDRPFQVGDWIVVSDIEGTVEEVGLRSTRIRTFAETLITVPNHKIAHEPINNYSRMPKRRVHQELGIGYDTEPERIKATVHALRNVLKNHPEVDQTFWMVNMSEFGESAINILIYYFTKTTSWAHYMQAKQDINLLFMEALIELGVEIAFPTRTLYMRPDEVSEKPDLENLVHIYSPRSGSPPAPAEGEGEG
jgi:MscS family membrane protein